MKKNKMSLILLTISFAFCFLVSSFTVFAAENMDELPGEDVPQEVQIETQAQPQEEQEKAEDPNEEIHEPVENNYEQDDQYNQYEQYIEELPPVESQEVQFATVLRIPISEISDTSLIGGIAAWLCVAVGIAVIVGVLVSRKTSNVRR